MRPERLMIVYKLDSFNPELAIQEIESVLGENQISTTGFKLSGKPINLTHVLKKIQKVGRKTFNIEGHGFEFTLACVRNCSLDALFIKSEKNDKISWDTWTSRFIDNPNFVMAWISDDEYEYWQNAHDLLQYTAGGRVHEHLPKKSNGLPFPLEQTIVDISGNPGRRLIRSGYYEVVGSTMWLGEHFWQLTKADRSEVEHSKWLQVSTPCSGVIRIESFKKCYTTADGIEGRLQNDLRSLLYPESGK